MVWFHESSEEAQAYEQVGTHRHSREISNCLGLFHPIDIPPSLKVQNAPHKAALSHELIAGAAAYEAAKAYEKHVAKNGQPDNHAYVSS